MRLRLRPRRPPGRARQLRSRYLAVLSFRWIPLGLLLPIFVVLMLDAGLSFAAIGAALALQSVTALLLEVPAGVAADRWGQRPVLLAGSAIRVAGLVVLVHASSFEAFALAWAAEGAARALDSGCLDAWYVNEMGPERSSNVVARTFSLGGTVIGLSVAAGSALTAVIGVLAEQAGGNSLVVPVVVALVVQGAHFLVAASVVDERRTVQRGTSMPGPPHRLLRGQPILLLLFSSELMWGFGMAGVEVLWQPQLVGTDPAAQGSDVALLGTVSAMAWVASAFGAAISSSRRVRVLGRQMASVISRLLQAAVVFTFALAEQVPALVLAYIAVYAFQGAANPLHVSLLHENVTDDKRTTVASVNSFSAQVAGVGGTLVLPGLAGVWSLPSALTLAAAIIAVSAIPYLCFRSAPLDSTSALMPRSWPRPGE